MNDADAGSPYALSFMVTGLDAASRYNYVLSTLDENGTPIHVYIGAFATTGYPGTLQEGGDAVIPTPPVIPSNPEASAPTSVDFIGTCEEENGKIFRNGQIIIRRGDAEYSIQGYQLK